MKEIKAIIQPFKLNDVLQALHGIGGLPGAIVSECRAASVQSDGSVLEVRKNKLEIMVEDGRADEVAQTIRASARTGHVGDGRVFVIPIERAIPIHVGEGEVAP